MTGRVALAVVGAGLIGRRHIEAIAASSRARLAAVVDPAEGARDLAARLGVPWAPGVEGLADGLAEAAILATPTALHVEGALACIARGLPVLVEKPLAADLAGARAIVAAARAAGVVAATGHHRRHNPLIAAAKAALEGGAIGRPVSVAGMFWLAKPDAYFDVPWRRAPGAGPVMTNLSHDIDLMRHLVGEVAEVQALASNAVRGHPVEETAVVILRFANGALGTFNVSDAIPAPWSWELTAGENPAYPKVDAACYLIGGTEGSLELPSGRLWHYAGPPDWWAPILARTAPRPGGDPLVRQVDQFAAAVRGEAPPLVPAEEGMRTMAVLEAVLASAREGRAVRPEA
jgi:predicted dehydrogenase